MLFVQFTGLSGAGKTTLAYRTQKRLTQLGIPVEVLDGDVCRRQLWPELTFSEADRQENIRRMGRLARMFTQQGILVLMAAINPYQHIRNELSERNEPSKTVFLSCELTTLISRDTKGLYARALLPSTHPDRLENLTGVNAVYEPPLNPDLILYTDRDSEGVCEEQLIQFIITTLRASTPSLFIPKSSSDTIW
ncbi:adenylyl-sulfate kinase [Spirosoma daeguense]